jgi:4-hydroxy-tetrahydrodipicolinate synthase
MKYRKAEAKQYAKQNMRGVWGASLTPFKQDYTIDEEGLRYNIRYCIDALQMEGMFLNGLYGEAFNQTIEERKRVMRVAVEEAKGEMAIMPYTSDSAVANVVNMTRYAEEIGADYVVIINPKFYFGSMTEEGVYRYYKYVAENTGIGIVLFNQMEHGYLMSGKLVSRIADIENVVAIKETAPAMEIGRTRALCDDRIVVSEVSEDNWLGNLTIRHQEVMIAAPAPFTLQSKKIKLVKEYTDLAMKGEYQKATEVCKSLETIRRTLRLATPAGKAHAALKYWTQCLGMAGGDGRVRMPLPELTEVEKQTIETGVRETGLV